MDYKVKYLKYKNKYINLKTQLGQGDIVFYNNYNKYDADYNKYETDYNKYETDYNKYETDYNKYETDYNKYKYDADYNKYETYYNKYDADYNKTNIDSYYDIPSNEYTYTNIINKTYNNQSATVPTVVQNTVPTVVQNTVPTVVQNTVPNFDHKSKIISKFLKKNKDKIRLNFLNFVCNDASLCLTFGKESKIIREFFNGFTSFDYVVSPSRRIGSDSVNGFIYLINYQRDNYNVSSVLKSSRKIKADNLVYEYEVGKYINEMSKLYSCFVETYGLFKYNNQVDYNTLSTLRNINDTNIFKKALTLINDDYEYPDVCTNSIDYCILTQHIKDAISLYDFLFQECKDIDNLLLDQIKKETLLERTKYELLYILFQIYFPLGIMSKNFTHYDLHFGNILLYKLKNNSYIEYNYYLPDGSLASFKSRWVVKIIDYGRSYFNNSIKIYEKVCRKCSNCGINHGFKFLNKTNDLSKDLRPIKLFKEYIANIYPDIYDILPNNLNFILKHVRTFNINSIYKFLQKDIIDNKTKNDAIFNTYIKIGELHTYSDGTPLSFIKV